MTTIYSHPISDLVLSRAVFTTVMNRPEPPFPGAVLPWRQLMREGVKRFGLDVCALEEYILQLRIEGWISIASLSYSRAVYVHFGFSCGEGLICDCLLGW
jgi:hypothetical protein